MLQKKLYGRFCPRFRGYKEGEKIEELPCWGCMFCVRMQDKWGKFEEQVDDVLPLAVLEVSLEPGGWVENYTKEELRKVQLEDDIVGNVLKTLCEVKTLLVIFVFIQTIYQYKHIPLEIFQKFPLNPN